MTLIDELRNPTTNHGPEYVSLGDLCSRAADEIERLRVELRNLQRDMDRAMLNHSNDLTN